MYDRIAEGIVLAAYGYVVLGILAALLFLVFGLERIDSEDKGSGIGFRAIIFPGLVALWPLLLPRAVRGGGEAPEQRDPHR